MTNKGCSIGLQLLHIDIAKLHSDSFLAFDYNRHRTQALATRRLA